MHRLYDFLKNKGVINKSSKKGSVIDIGSGNGKEGDVFKENGFDVTSIDGVDATDYSYPKERYDIAIAKNSLPFMRDKQLNVISNIHSTLKNGGYFYGTVFGKEDPWAKEGLITPMDFMEVLEFLNKIGFKIIWQCEEKGLGKTMKGEFKDWHILKFLVRK
jgi:SAM-dependent methyltransferase